MQYLIFIGCMFALIYSFGSRTNGTKSPHVMILGGLGWIAIFLLSIVISFLDRSFSFWSVLWTGLVTLIVATMVFKKMFKYSFLDELNAKARYDKKLRMVEKELARDNAAMQEHEGNTGEKRFWQP